MFECYLRIVGIARSLGIPRMSVVLIVECVVAQAWTRGDRVHLNNPTL